MRRLYDEHDEQWDAFKSAVEDDFNSFMKKVFAAFHSHTDFIPAFIKSVFDFEDDFCESLFCWMNEQQTPNDGTVEDVAESLALLTETCAAISIPNELDAIDVSLLNYPKCDSFMDDAQRAKLLEQYEKEWNLLSENSEKARSGICTFVKENELSTAQTTALFDVVEKLFLREYDTDSIDADEMLDLFNMLPPAIKDEVL